MKKTILILVPLLVVSFVLAKGPKGPQGPKGTGPLDPPATLTATQEDDTVLCEWSDVADATKYALQADLTVTITVEGLEDPIVIKLDPCTCVPASPAVFDAGPAIDEALAELGPDVDYTTLITGTVRCKSMNPGKKAGPQNGDWFEAPVLQPVAE